MSSTTRLLVLGVVKLFQPVHGYEVRRELLSWRAQDWASVQPGSIYSALKTLTRDGLLEVASTRQVGGRPERTAYRLTSVGEEEFHTLLRQEWWTVRPPVDPLMAALSFLSEISRAEAISALEHRAAQIHGMVRHVEFGIDAHDGSDSPYHVREMMRLMNVRVAAELAWSEQFLARLRSGEYATADDPPWQPPARPGSGSDGARATTLDRGSGAPARRGDRAPGSGKPAAPRTRADRAPGSGKPAAPRARADRASGSRGDRASANLERAQRPLPRPPSRGAAATANRPGRSNGASRVDARRVPDRLAPEPSRAPRPDGARDPGRSPRAGRHRARRPRGSASR